jgi:hypothetical protein
VVDTDEWQLRKDGDFIGLWLRSMITSYLPCFDNSIGRGKGRPRTFAFESWEQSDMGFSFTL